MTDSRLVIRSLQQKFESEQLIIVLYNMEMIAIILYNKNLTTVGLIINVLRRNFDSELVVVLYTSAIQCATNIYIFESGLAVCAIYKNVCHRTTNPLQQK